MTNSSGPLRPPLAAPSAIVAELPDKALPLEQQRPLISLAMLVFGEGRGEPIEGKLGIAHTVGNRLKLAPHYGVGWQQIIFKPQAYSCFNRNDVNRAKLLDPLVWGSRADWEACYSAAYQVYHELAADKTEGSTHYVAARLYPDHLPAWCHAPNVKATVVIGGHRFYREEWAHA